MMRRRIFTVVALALCLASSPALAHGVEGFVRFLVITGAGVGLFGGAVAAMLPYRAVRTAVIGLLASEGLLFVGGMLYTVVDMGTSSDPIGELGAMALWLAVFSAAPLAVTYLIVFAGTSLFRWHVWPGKRGRAPAP
jgi:hypothetical protein